MRTGTWPEGGNPFRTGTGFLALHATVSGSPPLAVRQTVLIVCGLGHNQIAAIMEPRGIYRERNGWGNKHCVRVKYDEHQELDVPEDRYRARGYQPPFDELPWKDEAANNT